MKTTERDISRFIDDGGWVAERQKFVLSDAQLQDLIGMLNAKDEEKQSLAPYLQHIFQHFCVSCERYFERKERYGKKVTTALREKKNVIEPLIHQLSEALDDLDKNEVEWLFSSPFDAMTDTHGLVKQMQDGLMAMEYLLENNEIEVTRSDNNLLLRNTLIALAALLEDKVGIICRRHFDNIEEIDIGPLHDFARQFFSYVPSNFMKQLSSKPASLEKTLRNALKEFKELEEVA